MTTPYIIDTYYDAADSSGVTTRRRPWNGAVVHYVTAVGEQPTPCMVTRVVSDEVVNLTAFFDGQQPGCLPAVQFSESPAPGCWFWPEPAAST